MSAEIIDLSKFIKGVHDKTIAVYEDVPPGEIVCADGNPVRPFTSWMNPKKKYDLTEFPDDVLFDADVENFHYNVEELAMKCHREFLIGHEKLLSGVLSKWNRMPEG